MTTGLVGFTRSGNTLYMIDSRGSDTAALMAIDMPSGEANWLPRARRRMSAGDPPSAEKVVQAVAFVYARKEWQVLDTAIVDDLVYLGTVADGEVEVTSRTVDDAWWIVAYVVDDGPAALLSL